MPGIDEEIWGDDLTKRILGFILEPDPRNLGSRATGGAYEYNDPEKEEIRRAEEAASWGFLEKLKQGAIDTRRWFEHAGLGDGYRTPEDAEQLTDALLLKALGTGFAALGISWGLEYTHFLKQVGFGQAAGLVAQFAGFGPIVAASHANAIRNGYGVQYNKYNQRRYRPHGPSLREAEQMNFQGHLSDGELRAIYEYAGWPDHRIDQRFKSRFVTPSARTLTGILQEADLPLPWVERKLLDQGFSPEDAGILAQVTDRKAQSVQRGAYVNAVVALYRDGWMDEGQCEERLRKAGLRAEALQLNLERARLQKDARDADLILDAALAQFKAGVIDDVDFEGIMRSLGIEARTAAHIKAKAIGELGVRKFKEAEAEERVRKNVLAQASFEALSRGLISLEIHHAQLIAAGFPADLALNMAERDALRLEPSVKRPPVRSQAAVAEEIREELGGASLAAVRAGLMEPEIALANLIQFGELPQVAAAKVQAAAVARDIRLAREREREEESAEQKAARAAELAAARERAAQDAQRKRVAEKVSATITQATLAQLRKGFLSPEEAYANLVTAGHPPELAEALVINALSQAARAPKPAPAGGPSPEEGEGE